MNLPFLWGFDRSWMNYSPFCFLGDQWVKCVRLKHICSVFGIFPSYTPCFFKKIILELKTLREARTLWCWGNSDPLDHIHSCLHLAALLPKVTLPVPSENPNLLNGHEWNTPCAWMWGRGFQSHGSSLERRRLFLGDHLDALHVMCYVLLRGGLASTAPQQTQGAAVPPASTGTSITCYCLCLCFSKHLCSTSTLRVSVLEGEFPSW